MPIIGLTDLKSFNMGRALPRIGKLRKGGEKQPHKSKKGKDGKPLMIYGPDLDYFRVTFKDEFSNLAPDFERLYGKEPMEFQHVRFFVPDVETAFETWYEDWDAAQTLLRRCDGDDQHLHYLPKLGTWGNAKIPCQASCINARNNGDSRNACQRIGRLKVVLTDFTFETGAYGYFSVETGSIHDILNLHSGLRFLHMNFGTLIGIEFVLGRTKRLISTPMGKDSSGNVKRGKTKKSLLYIRPANDFVKNTLLAPPEPGYQLDVPKVLELGEATRHVDTDTARAALGNGEERRVGAEPEPEIIIEVPETALDNGATEGEKRQQIWNGIRGTDDEKLFDSFQTFSAFALKLVKSNELDGTLAKHLMKAAILAARRKVLEAEILEHEALFDMEAPPETAPPTEKPDRMDEAYAKVKDSFANRAAFDAFVKSDVTLSPLMKADGIAGAVRSKLDAAALPKASGQ